MGIEDEKTRPVKAVKRRVTDVATRRVKAVKRAPKADEPDQWAGFLALHQADVLRRGALVNEAGEKDDGWVFREPFDKTDLAWFSRRAEAALATLARWMDQRAGSFDVMLGGECVAVLELGPRLRSDRDAFANLRSSEGGPLAALDLKAYQQSVECFVDGRSVLLLEQAHPKEALLIAGRRAVGTLHRRPQPGLLRTTYDLELSFDRGASGFERLCGAAMIVFQDAWRLAPRTSSDDSSSWD